VRRIAVVGSGLLGCLTSLLAARSGMAVDLFEQDESLFTGASLINEGKVHLGPIFAMADSRTHSLMVEAGLQFADIVDSAVGSSLDWTSLTGAPFDYLVMPGSLLTVEELASAYARVNALLERGSSYLGRDIDVIVHPQARPNDMTGLPSFHTEERAIDVRRLREIVVSAVEDHPLISVSTGARVDALRAGESDVDVVLPDRVVRVDAAINCAWDGAAALLPTPPPPVNYRVKAAVRLDPWPGAPTLTLVQGPFGDVVGHSDHVYISWYPIGRLAHESGVSPSPAAREALVEGRARVDLAQAQARELQRLGVIPDPVSIREVVAGFILGDGDVDIDQRSSLLHQRGQFGVRRNGMIFTPANFKLTTAPLAARHVVATVTDGL
jgi:glycine/D-amino acid oxidase-like deaminating enzyme